MARDDATSHHYARAVSGDDRSRLWLADHLFPFVLAHAHSRLHGENLRGATPEEVADYTMMRLLDRLDGLQARDGRIGPVIRAFLRQTLVQQVANSKRTAARDRLVPAGDGENANPRSTTTSTSSRVARSERSEVIMQALGRLPLRDREIIVLRYWEEESWSTIAERIAVPEATLRKRGERAMRRLRDALPPAIVEDFLGVP